MMKKSPNHKFHLFESNRADAANSDLILNVEQIELNPGDKYTRYGKKNDSIEFIASGSCAIRINKLELVLKKSDLVFIHSYDEYEIFVNSEQPLTRYVINVSEVFRKKIPMEFKQSAIISGVKNWVSSVFDQVIECSQSYDDSLKLNEILINYLVSRLEIESKVKEHLPCSTYGQIRSYIELNYKNIRRIEDVSEHCKVSISHIGRLFNQHSLERASQLLNRLKLEESAKMLETGNYLIKEISNALSFESPLYFSSRFKIHFGVSPKNYTKSQIKSVPQLMPKAG